MSNKVFLDIVIGNKAIGRIDIELFFDVTPKTAENFRGLCTGIYGLGKVHKKKLHYLGSRFHKIEEDQYIEAGDIIFGNGTGGESIYGETFNDENFHRRHACAGLLSMVNKGRNTNNSKFMITLKPLPDLDGKNVVFGQVIGGMEVVREISKVPLDIKSRPIKRVTIFNCGDYDLRRIHITEDPFKNLTNAIHEERLYKEKIMIMGPEETEEYKQKRRNDPFSTIQEYENENEHNINNENQFNEYILDEFDDDDEEEDTINKRISEKFNKQTFQKFMELKAKMNEARNLNTLAVKEETFKQSDPKYETNKLKQEYKIKKCEMMEMLKSQGLPEDKSYVLDSINKCENIKKLEDKKKKNIAFGWDGILILIKSLTRILSIEHIGRD